MGVGALLRASDSSGAGTLNRATVCATLHGLQLRTSRQNAVWKAPAGSSCRICSFLIVFVLCDFQVIALLGLGKYNMFYYEPLSAKLPNCAPRNRCVEQRLRKWMWKFVMATD